MLRGKGSSENTSIGSYIIDIIAGRVKPDPDLLQRREVDFLKVAIRMGVERTFVAVIRKHLGDSFGGLKLFSAFFHLQDEIYVRKIRSQLDFLEKLKEIGDFILIKGVGLAQKYYGNLTERHLGDIDVLVDERQASRFSEFLLDFGMRKIKQSEIKGRIGHSEQFSNGDISVGLHTNLCDRLFADIRYEEVKSRRTLVSFGAKRIEVFTLTEEWDLIELSLHAFQHAFAPRIMLDISKVLKSQPDLAIAREISRKKRIEKILNVAVVSSAMLFSRDVLEDVFEKLEPSFLDVRASGLVSSKQFLFLVRDLIFLVPYADKLFSLALARSVPFRKLLTISPLIPKEFIRRLKGEYAITD